MQKQPEIPLKATSIICALLALMAFGAAWRITGAQPKQQTGNVAKPTAPKPIFRRKTKGVTKMIKINVESLPATITAGLDDTIDPNPHCDIDVGASGVQWSVTKIFPDNAAIANEGAPNGWSVAPGGVIGIPDGIEYGKYQAVYASPSPDGVCDDNENFGYVYHYVFKITPPCPTSVTLTAN